MYTSVQPSGCKRVEYGPQRHLVLPRHRWLNCCFTQSKALPKERSYGSSIVAATLIGAAIAGCEAVLPSSVHAADSFQSLVHSTPSPIADVANEAPFWENVLRYVQYFFSIMLGTVYVMLKPFARLLRNPLTGVLVIGGTVALVYAIKITVTAMLGVDDLFEYSASSIVTAQTT